MSPAARLRRLRWRLALMVAVVAAVGLGFLALVATVVDGNLRGDEAAAYRQGLASRLAALIYPDDNGVWMTEGVVDDVASASSDGFVVATRSGEVLYQVGAISGYDDVLAAGVADEPEVGVQGEVELDGVAVGAAAAPFWDFETVEGAVVVAWADQVSEEHRRLRFLVWSAALAMTALSGVAAWTIAGRVVQPMGEALNREERFLATAAHEIRTPLGRVRALAESAQRTAAGLSESPTSLRLNDELRRLVDASSQAAESAGDLLLAGRIDADQLELRREPLRLDLLVADFENTVASLAVETFEPVTVDGDRSLLRHTVGNLLGNAQQHGHGAGPGLLIEASVLAEGPWAVVRVVDNGPGLQGVDAERIFERHVKGGQGTGLGLWIVWTIVNEHGGTIAAADRAADGWDEVVQTGAVFEIRLPLSSAGGR